MADALVGLLIARSVRSITNFGKVYSRLLDSRLLGLDLDNGTIDEGNKAITDAILQAAKRSVPRGHVKKFFPTWSDELAKAIELRQAARKAFAREPSTRNRKKYNALCRRAKRVGQEAGLAFNL